MKKIRIAIIAMFCAALLAPVAAFNWEENYVSPIDNRELMNNPFGDNYIQDEDSGRVSDLTSYVEDRIGFREQMIYGYTVLNDALFHKMVHTTYDYGEDGYVFFKTGRNIRFGEFHREFAEFIKKVQDYCEERDVPFVFVFNPAKTTVLSDKLREGINYDAGWVQEFLGCLDDLGAFYGCNAILEYFQQYFPDLHINTLDDYVIEQRLNTSLMVSEFPIHEYEPVFEPVSEVVSLTDQYSSEVDMDYQYWDFRYLQNPERMAEGAPKVLCFQGSYMNEMGYKFLENSFGEYIVVHDYQNVMNLDYYFNIFQPDCVIFETAEYTLTDEYYNLENMMQTTFNPALDETDLSTMIYDEMPDGMLQMTAGSSLTEITVTGLPENTQSAYLSNGALILDLMEGDSGYCAEAENGDVSGYDLQVIAVLDSGEVICFS